MCNQVTVAYFVSLKILCFIIYWFISAIIMILPHKLKEQTLYSGYLTEKLYKHVKCHQPETGKMICFETSMNLMK